MNPKPALLALLAASSALADPFFLVDEEGASHGPFELGKATEIALSGRVYKVERLPDEAQALVDALKKSTLPAFRFADARLPELVELARGNTVAQNAALAGVAFLIVDLRTIAPAAPPATASDSAQDSSAAALPEAPAKESPSGRGRRSDTTAISFEVESMNTWDFLNQAASFFSYRVEVDAKAVRLLHPRIPDGPQYLRVYNVLPTLVERMVSFREYRQKMESDPRDPFAMRSSSTSVSE